MKIYMFKYIIVFLFIISCIKTDIAVVNFIHLFGVLDNENEIILFEEINNKRIIPLLLDANFNLAASRRIEYIKKDLEEGYEFSHSGYSEALYFLDSLGIKSIGENLAYRYTRSESVIYAWVVSETHFKNLSAKKWKYIGISIGEDEEEYKIYCAIFGY